MIDMQATFDFARGAAALMDRRRLEDSEVRALASGKKTAAQVLAEIRAGAPQGMLLAAIGLLSQQDTDVMSGVLLGTEHALRHGLEASTA